MKIDIINGFFVPRQVSLWRFGVVSDAPKNNRNIIVVCESSVKGKAGKESNYPHCHRCLISSRSISVRGAGLTGKNRKGHRQGIANLVIWLMKANSTGGALGKEKIMALNRFCGKKCSCGFGCCSVCGKNDTCRSLDTLELGKQGTIQSVAGDPALRKRLLDMGLTPKTRIMVRKIAPFGDPIEVFLRNYELTLRKEDARHIQILLDGGV